MISRIQIWLHRNLWTHSLTSESHLWGNDTLTMHTCQCGKEWTTR